MKLVGRGEAGQEPRIAELIVRAVREVRVAVPTRRTGRGGEPGDVALPNGGRCLEFQ